MKQTSLFLALLLASPLAGQPKTSTEEGTTLKPSVISEARLPIEGDLPSFKGASAWINSQPLTPADLRGKVVLVDICTYSCINWLRHLPYVRAWAEKYKDRGLVVIGVHSPEFGFEKNLENVRRALKAMDLTWPVAVDNDHAVWNAFDNQAWPALYFVDAQGHIRHRYYGEGEYPQSEEILQKLLSETGRWGDSQALVSLAPRGVESAADWENLRSTETYAGYGRTENFASPGGIKKDKQSDYSVPEKLKLNHWALAGKWTMGTEAAVLRAANGKIAFRFHSRDLHLVMGPPAPGVLVRFRVLIDGHPPGEAHGLDADQKGDGVVTEPRLYQLIRQPGSIEDRSFEIEFLDPGVEAFSFTFG